MIRFNDESDLLNPEFRTQVMQTIFSPENLNRKRAAYRRYEIYKKIINKHLREAFENEGFEPETIAHLMARASNVGIATKIVNKKARCYQFGIQRTSEEGTESIQEAIDRLGKLTNFDEKQKKIDRLSELHMNSAMLIIPVPTGPSGNEFTIEARPMQPFSYDVIEDPNNPEKPKVYILSDYTDQYGSLQPATEAEAGRHVIGDQSQTRNRRDDVIADHPDDQGEGLPFEAIWWCDSYHFTTDREGAIISVDQDGQALVENPIGMLPIVNYAIDQDGFFWAQGGDDVIDGTILINKTITDMLFIMALQGFGIPIISGMDLPRDIKYGPGRPILAERKDKEDPDIKVEFVNPSPPIEGWMRVIEMYTALLLSSNDVSPGAVTSTLNASNFQSGVAMMLDKSEAINEIDDKQSMFSDGERQSWAIMFAWLRERSEFLTTELREIPQPPEGAENLISFKFGDASVMESERERLENIKIRKDLGINEMVDLIMIDNPDMTREQAQKKLKAIMEEKVRRAAEFMENAISQTGQEEQTGEEEEEEGQTPPIGDEDGDEES